jgi:hypothetical protein
MRVARVDARRGCGDGVRGLDARGGEVGSQAEGLGAGAGWRAAGLS